MKLLPSDDWTEEMLPLTWRDWASIWGWLAVAVAVVAGVVWAVM